jgi:hypothetical protein
MATQNELNEALIIDLLRREESLKLEEVVALLPQLSWNQVFQCVDSLSRRGKIILHRRGFDYEVVRPSRKPHSTPCSV